jgi:hypothetical protein
MPASVGVEDDRVHATLVGTAGLAFRAKPSAEPPFRDLTAQYTISGLHVSDGHKTVWLSQ